MFKLTERWKGLFAVAASAAIAVPLFAAPQSVQAQEAGGIAYLELNDVSFTWESDGATVDFSDVNIGVSSANTGDTEASLTGFPTATDTKSTLISAGGAVDPVRSCVGDCTSAPAENSQTVTTGLAGTTFSSSDAFLTGATISGIGQPVGATAVARADSQLNTNATSSANSNVGTTTQFSFAIDAERAGDALVFNYDFITRLYAELSPDAGLVSSVLVAVAWSISIEDNAGNEFLNVAPDRLNETRSVGDLFGGPVDATFSGIGESLTSDPLPVGVYTLTIRHNANLDATLATIPEPGTLALFALGLTALSAVGWRSRKSRRLSDASEA